MTANTLPTPASYTSLGRDAARRAVFARLFEDAAQRAYADHKHEFTLTGAQLPWWADAAFCRNAIPVQWEVTYYPETESEHLRGRITSHALLAVRAATNLALGMPGAQPTSNDWLAPFPYVPK